MTITYSINDDLYLAFGKENVNQWADVNSNGNPTEISARLDWARVQAKDEIDSKLQNSRYSFPLDLTTITAPPLLKRMEAYLACMILSEARSIADKEEGEPGDLRWIAKRFDRFIQGVRLGTIQLGGVPEIAPEGGTEAPFVVNDFPQLDRWCQRDRIDYGSGFHE
jgi:phage gp36-like protein